MNEAPHRPEKQPVPWTRLVAETTAIVASILLAFAIDAWWQDLARSEDEIESLELIRRDLQDSVDQLNKFSDYAAGAQRSALRAYSALSGPGPYDREAIRTDLVRVDRKTLRLPRAAYTELLSTGKLRVIQDRSMRDAIVRFYEHVELAETIIQKNNDVILDRQLQGQYYESGLLLPYLEIGSGDELIDRAYAINEDRLGEDFVHRIDPIWDFESDSPEWRRLRSVLLNAALIHAVSETKTDELAELAAKLESEIDDWLGAD